MERIYGRLMYSLSRSSTVILLVIFATEFTRISQRGLGDLGQRTGLRWNLHLDGCSLVSARRCDSQRRRWDIYTKLPNELFTGELASAKARGECSDSQPAPL